MVEEEETIFGFPIVQAKGRKRRGKREEIKVWNFGMEFLYGKYHKPYLFMGC